MIFKHEGRRIVRSLPGPGTCDVIIEDEDGRTYRRITEAEAQQIQKSTAGQVYRLHKDGRIR